MDISAVVLHKLLTDQDLDLWARLKLGFLDPAYSSVYSAISRHYNKYNTIPTFEDLEISLREGVTSKAVAALKLVEAEDIDPEVALDALIDQYTQNETIKLLDKFVDKLPLYDTVEIKDSLANIVLVLDDKTLTTEGVFAMNDILLFQHDEELARNRVFMGINNAFDAALMGVARQELILIGGKRGAGKSITGANIMTNQYEMGNSSVYFSIEMTGRETLERAVGILSEVNQQALKQNKLSKEEVLKVVKVRAGMFQDSQDLVEQFMKDGDRFQFESKLIREKTLKTDNQMIIIDDRALTLASIDLHIGKLKAKFGDKLTVAVVDYLNQIVVEGGYSQFDWQPQVVVSKKLKEIARKHDIIMVSPYQIDATGEARFAKGILDAADISLIMEAHDKDTGAISYQSTKMRGAREMTFTSPIDWDTLRISSASIDAPAKKELVKKAGKNKPAAVDDSSAEIPWKTD